MSLKALIKHKELFGTILFDATLSPAVRAMTLAESNMTIRDDLAHNYAAIYRAKIAMYQSVYAKYGDQLTELYESLVNASIDGPHKDQLQDRALKNFLLESGSCACACCKYPSALISCTSSRHMIKYNATLRKRMT